MGKLMSNFLNNNNNCRSLLHMIPSLDEGICESLIRLFQCETTRDQGCGPKTRVGSISVPSHEALTLWPGAFSFCTSFLTTWTPEQSHLSPVALMEATHWHRHREQRNILHPKLLMTEPFISRFQPASEDWVHSRHRVHIILLELGSNFELISPLFLKHFSLNLGLCSFIRTKVSLSVFRFPKISKTEKVGLWNWIEVVLTYNLKTLTVLEILHSFLLDIFY